MIVCRGEDLEKLNLSRDDRERLDDVQRLCEFAFGMSLQLSAADGEAVEQRADGHCGADLTEMNQSESECRTSD